LQIDGLVLVQLAGLVLGFLGIADIDEVVLEVACLLDLECVVADVAEGQVLAVVLLRWEVELGVLVSIVGVVGFVGVRVGAGQVHIVIGELAGLELHSGIDLIIAHVFRLVLVVHVIFLVLLLPYF
jgi:hypothetical protein